MKIEFSEIIFTLTSKDFCKKKKLLVLIKFFKKFLNIWIPVSGVVTDLSPFEIRWTWLSVSWRLERFLMNLSFAFFCVAIRFLSKVCSALFAPYVCVKPCSFLGPFTVVWFSGKRLLYFSISLLFADVCSTCVYNICWISTLFTS